MGGAINMKLAGMTEKGFKQPINIVIFSVFLGLEILGWIVGLGGLSATTKNIDDANQDTIVVGVDWFLLLIQPILISLGLYSCFADSKFADYDESVVIFIAMITGAQILRTHEAVVRAEHSSGDFRDSYAAYAAGLSFMIIMQVLLIIFMNYVNINGICEPKEEKVDNNINTVQRENGFVEVQISPPPPTPVSSPFELREVKTQETNTTNSNLAPPELDTGTSVKSAISFKIDNMDENDPETPTDTPTVTPVPA